MQTLEQLGYAGPIGLEYKPSASTTDSLLAAKAALRVGRSD